MNPSDRSLLDYQECLIREIGTRLPFLRPFAPALFRLFFGSAARLIGRALEAEECTLSTALQDVGIRWECAPEDIEKIPASGPAMLTANHPFGLIEGPILGDIVARVRPDFRFLADYMTAKFPRFGDMVIPIWPASGAKAQPANRRTLRDALEWLRSDAVLIVFPAGKESGRRFPSMEIAEGQWDSAIIRLASRSGARIVPAFLHGGNSWIYYLAEWVHPGVCDALRGREVTNKAGRIIRVSLGEPIEVPADPDDGLRRFTQDLRARTLQLGKSRRVADEECAKAMV
jgi:putative hemolysin